MTDSLAAAGLHLRASALQRVWWLVLLRGVAAVLFSFAAFAWPGPSLLTLVLFFGVYALIEGAAGIAAALGSRSGRGRWWLAAAGVFSLAAGIGAFAWPGLTAVLLVMIIGLWSIFRGASEIAAAVTLHRQIRGEWALAAAGAISILFGLALIASPGAGALALLWLIAAWALAFGALMIIWAFRLRALHA